MTVEAAAGKSRQARGVVRHVDAQVLGDPKPPLETRTQVVLNSFRADAVEQVTALRKSLLPMALGMQVDVSLARLPWLSGGEQDRRGVLATDIDQSLGDWRFEMFGDLD
jgi:hypothetical protein